MFSLLPMSNYQWAGELNCYFTEQKLIITSLKIGRRTKFLQTSSKRNWSKLLLYAFILKFNKSIRPATTRIHMRHNFKFVTAIFASSQYKNTKGTYFVRYKRPTYCHGQSAKRDCSQYMFNLKQKYNSSHDCQRESNAETNCSDGWSLKYQFNRVLTLSTSSSHTVKTTRTASIDPTRNTIFL